MSHIVATRETSMLLRQSSERMIRQMKIIDRTKIDLFAPSKLEFPFLNLRLNIVCKPIRSEDAQSCLLTLMIERPK